MKAGCSCRLTRFSFLLFSCFPSVWRIVIGLSLIPAFGTLYSRLTLKESTRFEEARKIGSDDDPVLKQKADQATVAVQPVPNEESDGETPTIVTPDDLVPPQSKKAQFRGELVALASRPRSL